MKRDFFFSSSSTLLVLWRHLSLLPVVWGILVRKFQLIGQLLCEQLILLHDHLLVRGTHLVLIRCRRRRGQSLKNGALACGDVGSEHLIHFYVNFILFKRKKSKTVVERKDGSRDEVAHAFRRLVKHV